MAKEGSWLQRLDNAVLRVEQFVCIALLGAMAVSVFADTLHRQSTNEGKLERLFARWMPMESAIKVSLAVALVLLFIIVYGALRTARMKKTPTPKVAAGLALVISAAIYAGVKLLGVVFPNGFFWSQAFALYAMLWVGMLGASMATKEKSHLTLEIMEFAWKGRAKAHIGRVGALIAAAFCLFLAWLSYQVVDFWRGIWVESEGLSGAADAFPVPKYVMFGILPVTLTVMALRFLGRVLGPTEEEKPPDLKPVMPPPDAPASLGSSRVETGEASS
jgi:TRAP-type C4-dicarboxylate transport system permease small subunit